MYLTACVRARGYVGGGLLPLNRNSNPRPLDTESSVLAASDLSSVLLYVHFTETIMTIRDGDGVGSYLDFYTASELCVFLFKSFF